MERQRRRAKQLSQMRFLAAASTGIYGEDEQQQCSNLDSKMRSLQSNRVTSASITSLKRGGQGQGALHSAVFLFPDSTCHDPRQERKQPCRVQKNPQPFNICRGSMPSVSVALSILLLLLLPGTRGQGSNSSTAAPTVSDQPTNAPVTSAPTMAAAAQATGLYRQEFYVPANPTDPTAPIIYNSTQTSTLAAIFESYTESLGINQTATPVDTICIIENQVGFLEDNQTINSIDYSCTWSSSARSVDTLPVAFLSYVSDNLVTLMANMSIAGLPVFEAYAPIVRTAGATNSPTMSPPPSPPPTKIPTISPEPTHVASEAPTMEAMQPTGGPNFLPIAPIAPVAPTSGDTGGLSAGAISGIVIFIGVGIMLGLFAYYFSWKKKRASDVGAPPSVATVGGSVAGQSMVPRHSFRNLRPGGIFTSNGGATAVGEDGVEENVVISPTDSLLSHKSMVSVGDSGLGDDSGDEMDNTKNLQDEFDEYKDQNLELLRQQVEGNLTGFENIMSAAVTNALMGDEEANVETQELLWGCNPNPMGEEIEASALFEVSDWLKRNESAVAEKKRAFMQEILNRMVRSVRFGVLLAEDASRTIHESAAILGLPLSEDLPMTTVIISGMRKTTTADDMKKALKEFGDIDVAAVASGRRGFGIVRFRRNKSVDRALRRYRSGEIVILDVSIQMKVLMPSGAVDSR